MYAFIHAQKHDFTVLQSQIYELWARYWSGSRDERLQYAPTDCFFNYSFPHNVTGLATLGENYHEYRGKIMLERQEGFTNIYNHFHDPAETATDIVRLRELHVEMDNAVASAYGWSDLVLGHGFHETPQGLRYTISEPARREVLTRLLHLNHQRHEEELRQGLHEGKKGKSKKAGKKGIRNKEGEQMSLL